jgi:tRNA pseudouridine38-40 synthase
MPTQRYKLTIAYRGTAYHGWQAQLHTPTYTGPVPDEGRGIPTVQETLARAVAGIVRHPVDVVGSSRTDAGVHAKGQIAHFETDQVQIPPDGLLRAINAALPADITVRALEPVSASFDAIRSTTSKRYQYAIWNQPERPTFFADLAWHRWKPLDVIAMRDAARRLVGTHDFASFARPGHGRENTVRTILGCDVARRRGGPLVVIGVEGTGFLWNMVRIIAGTLAEVGLGRIPADRIETMLSAKDRSAAGPTAPPHGLFLQWIKTRQEPDEPAPPPDPAASPVESIEPREPREPREPATPSIVVRSHHGQFSRQIVELARELPEFFAGERMRQLQQDVRFQRGFVAFADNRFAAFLLFNVIEGAGRVAWLGVRRDLHGHGIGQKLVDRLTSELRSAGIHQPPDVPRGGQPLL